MEEFGIASVAAITVICFLIGMGCKASERIDSKLIPTIAGVCGAVLGAVGLYVMPDFPAHDIINAIAIGVVSGLAATGIHQIGKQLGGE